MAAITVQMLGGFEIRVGAKPVLTSLNSSRKAAAVLQYLLLQKGEKVSHQVLIDAIWQRERTDNPDMALRAILHRIRGAIAQQGEEALTGCIITGRGFYQWNPALDCEIDVEQMLNASAAAANARSEAQHSKQCARIVSLYKGRLLPEQASEAWVEGRSVRLHTIYRSALQQQLEMMKQQGWNEQIVKLCRSAIDLDMYEERFYLEQIMALETLGREAEAREVARTGKALGCLHRNLVPELLPTAYRRSRSGETDALLELQRIAADLNKDCTIGAKLCNFITFRELYALQKGIQQRHGLPLLLGLLSLTPADRAAPGEQEAAMQELGDLICHHLRQSDVAAQYGANCYVVMFCGGIGSQKAAPLERIKIAFYKSPVSAQFLLNYSVNSPHLNDAAGGNDWGTSEKAIGEAMPTQPKKRGRPRKSAEEK